LASEKIRDDAYRAADQLVVDATADADAKLRQARFSVEARAVRDAAYAATADARAAAYAEAEQRHRDRMAAIQRYFGQQVMSRGSTGVLLPTAAALRNTSGARANSSRFLARTLPTPSKARLTGRRRRSFLGSRGRSKPPDVGRSRRSSVPHEGRQKRPMGRI
jgi:hypothetical protein